MSKKNSIANDEAFDDNQYQFDDPDTATLDEQGRSELSSQKKVTARGQKLATALLLGLGLIVVAWICYKILAGGHKVETPVEKKSEGASQFATPATKNFGTEFNANAMPAGMEPIEATIDPANPNGIPGEVQPIGLVDPSASGGSIGNGAVQPPVYYQPPPAPPVQTSSAVAMQPQERPKSAAELKLERQLASGFASGNGSGTSAGAPTSAGLRPSTASDAAAGDGDALGNKLQATAVSGVSAQRMMHRDYMISAGSMIDCGLETKFNSTVVGMLTCNVTRDIYSSSGRVVLIDRGSRIIGQYQGGLQQGQARVFVLWTRVETPRGIIMNIDSPAASALGESGMTGRVNNHFWKRFGGAMLVSVIDGLGKALGNAAANSLNDKIDKALDNENATNNFNTMGQSSSDVASTIIENTINIPPTMIKHQGDRVNVYVARDLDFSNVYRLEQKY